MTIVHIFKSRNACIISIPKQVTRGVVDRFLVEWERPPRKMDIREYRDVVLPEKVIPAILNTIRESQRTEEIGLLLRDSFIDHPEIVEAVESANRN